MGEKDEEEDVVRELMLISMGTHLSAAAKVKKKEKVVSSKPEI